MKRFQTPLRPSRAWGQTAMALTIGVGVSATLLAGCGAGGGNRMISLTPAGDATRQAVGSAVFSVQWPARTTKDGRLIPFAAESIAVRLTSADGTKLYGDALLVRPSGGGNVKATFDRVPIGAALLTASAFPKADGSGTAQAMAQTAVTVVQNQNTAVTLTMATTIRKLTVTPATSTIAVGESVKLIVTATDAAGAVVLITPSTLTWASSTPARATVDVTGTVTGAGVGPAAITATEPNPASPARRG